MTGTRGTLDLIRTEGWQDFEGRSVSVQAFTEGFGAGPADSDAVREVGWHPRALRVTRIEAGGVVEGSQITEAGYQAFAKASRAGRAAHSGERYAPFDPRPLRAATEGEVATCEASLPPTLTDDWIDAVNARLVRTRTALVRAEPGEFGLGSTCSYSLRLYGAAQGMMGCEASFPVDLARLEQLVAATHAYCRDPSLGIETIRRPLDALRVHPAP